MILTYIIKTLAQTWVINNNLGTICLWFRIGFHVEKKDVSRITKMYTAERAYISCEVTTFAITNYKRQEMYVKIYVYISIPHKNVYYENIYLHTHFCSNKNDI